MMQRVNDLNFWEPQVMAILNVTPDSFYSESRNSQLSKVLERAEEALKDGASIIDIGGYSSRPGAAEVDECEEIRRVEMGVSAVRGLNPNIPISIDTFRSNVVRSVVDKFGKIIINDITAGEADPTIIDLAAHYDLPYIAMHMRGTPQSMQSMVDYRDVTQDVVNYFVAKTEELTHKGVKNIILDPGFGFAKSLVQNYELMANMYKICELGYPVLSGISRKSMIYKLLETTPQEALNGTTALNWESLRQGATILRVHDVKEAVEVVMMYNVFSKR